MGNKYKFVQTKKKVISTVVCGINLVLIFVKVKSGQLVLFSILLESRAPAWAAYVSHNLTFTHTSSFAGFDESSYSSGRLRHPHK